MAKDQYIYQISTNPMIKTNQILFPHEEYDIGFGFIGNFSVMTGMNESIEKTIEAIEKSELVYISGEIDATTFFELGLATSLGKKVYHVTQSPENKMESQLPYELENLIPIKFEEFTKLIDNR